MKECRIYRRDNGCLLPGMEGFMAKHELDARTKEAIKQIESGSKWPSGIGKIDRGECELGAVSPVQCVLCRMGHMLECHYPYTCTEAGCKH